MTIVTGRPARRDRLADALAGGPILLAHVHVALRGLGEAQRDLDALREQVRPQLHDVAVLDRSRLALVGVHDHDPRPREAAHRRPFPCRREARPAVADEARRLQLRDDLLGLRAGGIAHLVGAEEVDRGPWLAECVTAGTTSSPRISHRRQVAVAEAGNLDRARVRLQQRSSAEAVADRPGADADDVDRQAQVRVEGDDLRHLAAADVHVVGERVRQVGRHRPDVAANPAEVVEQARAFARKRPRARPSRGRG